MELEHIGKHLNIPLTYLKGGFSLNYTLAVHMKDVGFAIDLKHSDHIIFADSRNLPRYFPFTFNGNLEVKQAKKLSTIIMANLKVECTVNPCLVRIYRKCCFNARTWKQTMADCL